MVHSVYTDVFNLFGCLSTEELDDMLLRGMSSPKVRTVHFIRGTTSATLTIVILHCIGMLLMTACYRKVVNMQGTRKQLRNYICPHCHQDT